jgi:DNA modification methylase
MIHAMDCLDFMKTKQDGAYDLVFTSPPFKDEDVEGDYWELYSQWFSEMRRISAKALVIIHSATRLNTLILKYPPKRTMVWGKGISQYSWRWNPILVYQISDDYKVNKFIWCDALGVEAVTGKWKVHKYQDPELLYETIIKMFKGCETVFDPFAGSGTTQRACEKLGLIFEGCEIDHSRFALPVIDL